MQFQLFRTTSARTRRPVLPVVVLAGAALALTVPATAAAEPEQDQAPIGIANLIPAADAPVPVGPGEYSYVATHEITQRAATMKAPEAIASLPVPASTGPRISVWRNSSISRSPARSPRPAAVCRWSSIRAREPAAFSTTASSRSPASTAPDRYVTVAGR
ncbi:hypothetical protein [Gordonia sp. BP-119]|uniref:hypothetical protein n=1 Tax=unclassified Gordonia (in: high G+C Gram-positive bacteria) TaxID=2657482 RepID=UPI000AEF3379